MSRLPYREHFFLSSAVHKEACFPVAVTIALALGGGGGGTFSHQEGVTIYCCIVIL